MPTNPVLLNERLGLKGSIMAQSSRSPREHPLDQDHQGTVPQQNGHRNTAQKDNVALKHLVDESSCISWQHGCSRTRLMHDNLDSNQSTQQFVQWHESCLNAKFKICSNSMRPSTKMCQKTQENDVLAFVMVTTDPSLKTWQINANLSSQEVIVNGHLQWQHATCQQDENWRVVSCVHMSTQAHASVKHNDHKSQIRNVFCQKLWPWCSNAWSLIPGCLRTQNVVSTLPTAQEDKSHVTNADGFVTWHRQFGAVTKQKEDVALPTVNDKTSMSPPQKIHIWCHSAWAWMQQNASCCKHNAEEQCKKDQNCAVAVRSQKEQFWKEAKWVVWGIFATALSLHLQISSLRKLQTCRWCKFASATHWCELAMSGTSDVLVLICMACKIALNANLQMMQKLQDEVQTDCWTFTIVFWSFIAHNPIHFLQPSLLLCLCISWNTIGMWNWTIGHQLLPIRCKNLQQMTVLAHDCARWRSFHPMCPSSWTSCRHNKLFAWLAAACLPDLSICPSFFCFLGMPNWKVFNRLPIRIVKLCVAAAVAAHSQRQSLVWHCTASIAVQQNSSPQSRLCKANHHSPDSNPKKTQDQSECRRKCLSAQGSPPAWKVFLSSRGTEAAVRQLLPAQTPPAHQAQASVVSEFGLTWDRQDGGKSEEGALIGKPCALAVERSVQKVQQRRFGI